ncbi:MAG TPA: potassium-transporting ATPase subunit KdpC [Thermoanaerobaculia bacterium]|nr:potassium-transporting ATPase subunit KdpC [Thermoanaerobaculia bacterium]
MKVMKPLVRSILFVVVTTVIFGGIYPGAVTLAARLLWRDKADGSFVTASGRTVGSGLIGQPFADPRYLHGRPSAAGKDGYDATSSSGTNLGPTSAALAKAVKDAVSAARADRPGDTRPVPADLVTSSASGLDPHLSPEAAGWQALRIAKARGVSEAAVLAVIDRHVEGRTLGFIGDPRVNVLLANIDLDRSFPRK